MHVWLRLPLFCCIDKLHPPIGWCDIQFSACCLCYSRVLLRQDLYWFDWLGIDSPDRKYTKLWRFAVRPQPGKCVKVFGGPMIREIGSPFQKMVLPVINATVLRLSGTCAIIIHPQAALGVNLPLRVMVMLRVLPLAWHRYSIQRAEHRWWWQCR